ncbi:hypothetical protein TI05_06965 [Achromatium sp. WMS3]|nr:hypothetical protein TI05_06965 [Achromatium sp. WMS3]
MKDLQQKLATLARKQTHIQKQWLDTGQKRLLKLVTTFMPKLLEAESCSIFIQDVTRDKVWLACSTKLGEREIEVPKQGSVVGEVISTGRSQMRTDMDKQTGIHKLIDSDTGFVTRNILCVPIKGVTTNETTGAIQALNKYNDQEFTEEDRIMLEEMAYHVQMLVENIFLGQEIFIISEKVKKRMAMVDMALWTWAAFMFVMGLIVIAYVTPFVINGF